MNCCCISIFMSSQHQRLLLSILLFLTLNLQALSTPGSEISSGSPSVSETALWPDTSWTTRLTLSPAAVKTGTSFGFAPTPKDYGMIAPGAPDDEYLVIDRNGRPLLISTAPYLQSRLASDAGAGAEGQTLVRFSATTDSFPVYLFYGRTKENGPSELESLKNHQPAYSRLMLETSQLEGRQWRAAIDMTGNRTIANFPAQWAEYDRLRRRARNIYGQKARERPTIDDLENPFGTHDLYMSRYEGYLYCHESGPTEFFLKADDGGLLSVASEKEPLLSVASPTDYPPLWKDAASANLDIDQPSLLHIAAYHIEIEGDTQGMTLGWRTPSMRAPSVVPPDAWLDYIPCRAVAADALIQSALYGRKPDDSGYIETAAVSHLTPLVIERRWLNAEKAIASLYISGTASEIELQRDIDAGPAARYHLPCRITVSCNTRYILTPVAVDDPIDDRRQSILIPFDDQMSLWEDVELQRMSSPAFVFEDEPVRLFFVAVRERGDLPEPQLEIIKNGKTERAPMAVDWTTANRREINVEFPAGALSPGDRIDARLTADGVLLDSLSFILFSPGQDALDGDADAVPIGVLARENEAEYRRGRVAQFAAQRIAHQSGDWSVRVIGDGARVASALQDALKPDRASVRFLNAEPDNSPLYGIGIERIIGRSPDRERRAGLPLRAVVDQLRKTKATALFDDEPAKRWRVAVIVAGDRDAIELTNETDIERSVDYLIDRSRVLGADRVIVVGPFPSPVQTAAAERYQRLLSRVCRDNHAALIDSAAIWTNATEFENAFSVGGDRRVRTARPDETPGGAGEKLFRRLADAVISAFEPSY